MISQLLRQDDLDDASMIPRLEMQQSTTLAHLRPGQQARITGFAEMGPTVQRLLHLGLLPGEVITLTRQALTGDPIEIRLLDYSLSLRRREAALVEVETIG